MAADVEGAVQKGIQAHFTAARAVTELPNDLKAAKTVHQVARVGGGRRLTLDHARISVQTFVAGSRSDARAASELVADWMVYGLSGTRIGNAVITRVEVDTAPTPTPYPNPDVRMAVATYTVHTVTV